MAGTDRTGYDIPHQLVEQLYRDTGVRTNPLRGIGFTGQQVRDRDRSWTRSRASAASIRSRSVSNC